MVGIILTGIGGLGTLALLGNLGSGDFGHGADGGAEFAGYIFGTLIVSVLPLVIGIGLLMSKPTR